MESGCPECVPDTHDLPRLAERVPLDIGCLYSNRGILVWHCGRSFVFATSKNYDYSLW